MSEELSRKSHRHIQQEPVGSGMETVVFGHEVERIQQAGDTIISVQLEAGKTVLKNYVHRNNLEQLRGFDQELRDKIIAHYKALCAQYGQKFFPQQRLLQMPNTAQQLRPETSFLLVQERVKPATTADIMDYTPDQLPDLTRQLGQELLEKRKASYRHYLEDPHDQTNRNLDFFGKSNLMVTELGELKCVDTSPKYGSYDSMYYPIPFILGTTAMFESVLGTSPEQLLSDPFYQELVDQPKCLPLKKLVNTPDQFRKRLHELVWSGALVVEK